MNEKASRVAVVTGGSGGIGGSVAWRLADDGMAVAVQYAGSESRARAVVEDIQRHKGSALAVRGDVTDPESMADLCDQVEREYGGLDVVVNTAGIMLLGLVTELNLDELDRMHRTNIRGTFVVSQQAAKRVRPGGAIINFSSSVARLQFPGYAGYAASKGAVNAMTLILARELRGKDITVNAVAPGPTATDLFLDGKDEPTIAGLAKAAPLERLGTPDDMAEAVAFLAGPGRWVNGQILYVNGGIG